MALPTRNERTNERTNDDRVARTVRADRLARVVVMAARTADTDPGTIEGVCGACPNGPSPSTFKNDCAREGERPADLRDLTRVLFAWYWAGRDAARIVEYLDADRRTMQALFARGRLTWLLDRPEASIEELLDRQIFCRNPAVVSAIHRCWIAG